MMSPEPSEYNSPRGAVILIHGVLNPRYTMWPLQRKFRRAGFQVLNCRYSSWGMSVDDIVQSVIPRCHQFHNQLSEETPLYILGHSLGTIVTRRLLQRAEFGKLKRVVMLAPPNRGSHVASRLGKYVRRLVPSIPELADFPESYVNQLPEDLPVEFGVVAATSDYVIDQKSTHLPSESDYILEEGFHSSILFRESVFAQSLHFMESGQFRRDSQ